ncbi:MAG TPA: hypothetical protein VGI78_05725 [Acetobacteraceae bacterium]|jgi:hypothetical protein
MNTDSDWRDSYGELKLPFLGAASQILDGNFAVKCPACGKHDLRFYYHVFDVGKDTGTLWVWCPSCRITAHLPRVQPKGWRFPDPFRDISPDDFGDMEDAGEPPFMTRLDDLWNRGAIGKPERIEAKSRERRKPARR